MGVPTAREKFGPSAQARPWWPWRRLTVVTYHRIGDPGSGFDADVVDATPAQFDRQVAMLKRHFTLVGTDDLADHLAGAKLPANPAMITFDDGYRDNHDVALPILRRHDVRAVFFVATGYVTERRLFWWERISHAVAQTKRERLVLVYPDTLKVVQLAC